MQLFNTVVNDSSACVRVHVSQNSGMTDVSFVDVGPSPTQVEGLVMCAKKERIAGIDINQNTWIVLSSQIGVNYYQTKPFQLIPDNEDIKKGVVSVIPTLSRESSNKTDMTTPPQLYVNAEIDGWVHIGRNAADKSSRPYVPSMAPTPCGFGLPFYCDGLRRGATTADFVAAAQTSMRASNAARLDAALAPANDHPTSLLTLGAVAASPRFRVAH
jgi:hypothetical protein